MSKKANSVTREQAREITAEIQQAVTAIIKKHGLDIESTKTGFGDFFEFKVRACSVKKVNGVNIESVIAHQWIQQAYFYGFTGDEAAALLGTSFGIKIDRQEVLLAGYNPRKKNRPFVGQTADGRQWELPEWRVRQLKGFKNENCRTVIRVSQ